MPSPCAESPVTAVSPFAPLPAKKPRLRKWLLRLGVSFLVLLVLLYAFRAPILRGLAWAWIVEDKLEKADAIVVIGGGLQYRPPAAAELYRQGYAPRVLVTHVAGGPAVEQGIVRRESDLSVAFLIRGGVPESAITVVGRENANTWEEAQAVRDWAKANAAKAVIVPTDPFNTRRVRKYFNRVLAEIGSRALVKSFDPPEYAARDWWRYEKGVVAFQNEFLKHLYYSLKY